MYHAEKLKTGLNQYSDGRGCIAAMTAVFIDGLSSQPASDHAALGPSNELQGMRIDFCRSPMPLPMRHRISKQEIKSFCMRIEKPTCKRRSNHIDSEMDSLRQFICGLSSCFNNILMGVWGNVSLLSMVIDPGHPLIKSSQQMDQLIQNGAQLIHALFGYLAERRLETKHLRLVQLIQEINNRIKETAIDIDIHNIENGMKLASQINQPSVVAECMARVLGQLLQWLNVPLQEAMAYPHNDKAVQKKLVLIDSLLKKGSQVVQQLELYGGNVPLKKKTCQISTLVKDCSRFTQSHFPHIDLAINRSKRLRSLHLDRDQMEFALQQLIFHTTHAMPEGGTIRMSMRSIHEETPEERCVVHQACDYAVITVAGQGQGMATHMQAKIFTPFLGGHEPSARPGLGLAAAAKVVQRHGGYIQVKSSLVTGSCFKVYLPTNNFFEAGRDPGDLNVSMRRDLPIVDRNIRVASDSPPQSFN